MIIFYFQKVNVETVKIYIYMHIHVVANGKMGVMKQNCKLSI